MNQLTFIRTVLNTSKGASNCFAQSGETHSSLGPPSSSRCDGGQEKLPCGEKRRAAPGLQITKFFAVLPFVKFLFNKSDDLRFLLNDCDTHNILGFVFVFPHPLLRCCLIHFILLHFSRMSSFIYSHTLDGIIIQHLMSCLAGDWMALTLTVLLIMVAARWVAPGAA